MTVARLALALVFIISAFGFLLPKIWELIGRTPILFLDLMVCIPAVVLGSFYWWKGRCFSSSWPVVVCVGLVWLSLFYPGHCEILRGTFIAALLTLPLPVAALIVEKRAWAFCAQVYVAANAAAMMAAIWFESRVESNIVQILGRFGFLVAADGNGRMGNPNQVGGQLALAAVLAMILALKGHEDRARGKPVRVSPDVNLALMILLSIGCVLTASRGAFASWFLGVGMLLVLGTRGQSMERLKDLLAISFGGLMLAAFLMAAGKATPWERLQERLADTRAIGSLSNRTDIWRSALAAWNSNPDYRWRGTGVGMADDVLGRFTPEAVEDEQGVLRKNCHNAFIEWILSFGLAGIVIGGCLGASVLWQAIRLDGREGNVGRLAILASAAVFAVSAVSYRHECWPATGALVLAMLTDSTGRFRLPWYRAAANDAEGPGPSGRGRLADQSATGRFPADQPHPSGLSACGFGGRV